MAKWSAILVILMVVIAALAVEAKWSEKDSSDDDQCYRECIKSCRKHDDGDCFEMCRAMCPITAHHSSSRRIPHGMESVEVGGRRK
ncbi:unnamed protein product [Arabidopsis thaliana]|uniref:(thale cress) hypothetical protein n=1 Tax=Arabidopsis thaliana TaxID=3702 RepID=A0A5S9WZX4_ARATH|nr:unnamed protein product [Arabidopsis thaliana]CAD5319031.1 unnamed protein product [Arabidopsis thaliana]VYS52963.1 unnamed protein product [Arabidopsis thaliana]